MRTCFQCPNPTCSHSPPRRTLYASPFWQVSLSRGEFCVLWNNYESHSLSKTKTTTEKTETNSNRVASRSWTTRSEFEFNAKVAQAVVRQVNQLNSLPIADYCNVVWHTAHCHKARAQWDESLARGILCPFYLQV